MIYILISPIRFANLLKVRCRLQEAKFTIIMKYAVEQSRLEVTHFITYLVFSIPFYISFMRLVRTGHAFYF